ncbi:type VI secretion system-associated FHA domain protein TagH [Shewanella waksmanii]|uniref:type VI secretion system-associated FHA domain protein TagH n=1 Tax=Shewanella waksmanii TaxID=213783 RepID=UPI000491D244|nr:type VI secretion system-associated FHA domain protein TagH [Shewanella waksmanii]
MELGLEIVSYHRLSPEQVSVKALKESISLGRSESNDWHLPDPEKVVSGVHARIEKQHDGFYLHDVSTNDLFVNRAVEALGKSRQHKLVDGDLLTFGDYEVKVTALQSGKNLDPIATGGDRSQVTPEAPQVSGIEVSNVLGGNAAPRLPVSEPLATTKQANGLAPQVSHDLQDHFQLPNAPIPEAWEHEFGASPNHTASRLDTRAELSQVSAKPQSQPNAQPSCAPETQVMDSGEMKAFFDGLGVAKEQLPAAVSEALLFEMGQGMKLMLEGLMATLRQRSSLKNQYRINQTTFQQQENNPLKFSASIDDVFQNLFLRRSSTFLSSKQAISAAFSDARKHDEAFIAGASGAMQGLLSQLDPLKIEQQMAHLSLVETVLPGQKQMKYWKVYKGLHDDMTSDFRQQGHAALSDDFIKAYDEKIKSL